MVTFNAAKNELVEVEGILIPADKFIIEDSIAIFYEDLPSENDDVCLAAVRDWRSIRKVDSEVLEEFKRSQSLVDKELSKDLGKVDSKKF